MSQSSKPVDLSMVTCTFLFAERGVHFSRSVVTAETKEDVLEKYFLKYPERKGAEGLEILDGDIDDLGWSLYPKEEP